MVKLTIVLNVDDDCDKNKVMKEVMQHIDHELVSITWSDPVTTPPPPPGQKPEDLGSTLSRAIDRQTGGR